MHYVIFLVLIVASLIVYAIRIRWFLYSVLLVYPLAAQMVWDTFSIFGLNVNLSMAYGSLIIFILLIEMVRLLIFHEKGEVDAVFLLILAFLFWCAMSVVISIDPHDSAISLTKVSTWLLLLLIAKRLLTRAEDLLTLRKVVVASCFIIIAFYLLARFGLYGAISERYGKWGVSVALGEFYSPVSLAYPLVMAIPVLMIGPYLKVGRWTSLSVIGVALLFALLTYVRAPALALLFGYVAFTYYLYKFRIRRVSSNVLIGLALCTLTFLAFWYLEPKTAFQRWKTLGERVTQSDTTRLGSGRAGHIINALLFIRNQGAYRTILGNGLGTSSIVYGGRRVVHNAILEVWLGCGIIGLLLYLSLLWKILQKLKSVVKKSDSDKIRILGCLGIMNFVLFISANFDVILYAVFPMCFLALHIGATMGLTRREHRHEETTVLG